MKRNVKELKKFAINIRKATIRCMYSFKGGHMGGSMSMCDALAVLYGYSMKIDPKNPTWEDRDWLVVSKGHCGPAVYATLALKEYFPKNELDTLNKEGTRLPSHCDRNRTPGIDVTTGSLGQGVSCAVGVAWAIKFKKKSNNVYTILGDGECDEGQVWEAALFAATKKLDNLIAFVDVNKKQLDGYTKNICDVGDLRQKFEDFGWFSQEVDGHDINAICDAIDKAKSTLGSPSMIILNTEKGKDCSFANQYYNHFIRFDLDQYNDAIKYLDAKLARIERED